MFGIDDILIGGLVATAVGGGMNIFGTASANSAQQDAANATRQANQQQWQADQEMYRGRQEIYGYQTENYDAQRYANSEVVRGQDVVLQGKQQAVEAQNYIIGQQGAMDAERQKAMELDATRRKREAVRLMVAERAQGLSRATNSGAAYGSSTAVSGVYGGASGRTGVNILGENQNLEIGRNLFGLTNNINQGQQRLTAAQSLANSGESIINSGQSFSRESTNLLASRTAQAQSAAEARANQYTSQSNTSRSTAMGFQSDANYYQGIASMGSSISSLGGAVIRNQGPIRSLATYATTPTPTGTSPLAASTSGANSYAYWS